MITVDDALDFLAHPQIIALWLLVALALTLAPTRKR